MFEIYIIWWSLDSGHIKLYMICINLYQCNWILTDCSKVVPFLLCGVMC